MMVVKYLFLVIVLLACACSSKVNPTGKENGSQYKIDKLKANKYHTIITVSVYDLNKERSVPSGIIVNGVVFIAREGFSSIRIIKGSYDVIVRSIGYQDAIIKNLSINDEDSVNIEVLLAEDHQLLY